MKLFREVKRIVSQFVETEYWYRFRCPPSISYDEETGEKEVYKYPYNQHNLLAHTWEGEDDILNIMIRKVEHMIVNLRKHGNQAYLYVLPSYILKYCTPEQKEYYFNKCLKGLANSSYTDIWYEDKDWNKSSKKTKRFCDKHSLFSIYLKKIDDNTHQVLRIWTSEIDGEFKIRSCEIVNKTKNAYTYSKDFVDCKIDEKLYVQDKDTKQYISNIGMFSAKPTHFELSEDFENAYEMKRFEAIQLCNENPTFKIVRKITSSTSPSKKWTYKYIQVLCETDMYEFERIFNETYPDMDYKAKIIEYDHTVNLTLQEYLALPKEAKEHVEGQRIVITQLLELRRKIKKLLKIDDCNDEYNPSLGLEHWDDLTQEQKEGWYKEASERYAEDRRKAYVEIAEFMAKYGNTWWD